MKTDSVCGLFALCPSQSQVTAVPDSTHPVSSAVVPAGFSRRAPNPVGPCNSIVTVIGPVSDASENSAEVVAVEPAGTGFGLGSLIVAETPGMAALAISGTTVTRPTASSKRNSVSFILRPSLSVSGDTLAVDSPRPWQSGGGGRQPSPFQT